MRDKRLVLSAGLLLACVMALFSLTDCEPVPLTATTGSQLFITANPTTIPAIGGVSTITVTGFRSAEADENLPPGNGTLPDGTQIFLTTTVGRIEERVEIVNGVARGFLRSDGRAGEATVVARSGSGVESAEVSVFIGAAGEGINILVTANPATVGPPDFTSQIVATVFDNDNNPLSDVPLVFSTSAGALASQGSILRTNQLGQASDRLTLENESSATVTATSGTVNASTTVTRGTVNNPVVSSVSPSSGELGETLNVTITGLNFQPGASVSFGQGIAINSVNFVSSTQLVVNITIDTGARVEVSGRTVTVTNPDGSSGSLPDAFRIVTALPAPRITNVSPGFTNTRDPNSDTLVITGFDFQAGAQVTMGPGIDVFVVSSSATEIEVDVTVEQEVNGGPAPGTVVQLTVINPDGNTSNGWPITVN